MRTVSQCERNFAYASSRTHRVHIVNPLWHKGILLEDFFRHVYANGVYAYTSHLYAYTRGLYAYTSDLYAYTWHLYAYTWYLYAYTSHPNAYTSRGVALMISF